MKDIHPKMENCEYICASCNTTFNILSTKGGKYSLDVCSHCHPYYVGNTSSTTLRGRAEKLSNKFEAGKTTATTAKPKKEVTKKAKDKKVVNSLESL